MHKNPAPITDHYRNIREFMARAGQHIPLLPTIPKESVRRFRARIIMEEALETVKGLGFDVRTEGEDWYVPVRIELIEFTNRSEGPSLVEIVDGCADVSVVSIGTLIACGVTDKPILDLVDAANLRKFGPGGHRREDGKWIKPPDWIAPDIAGALRDQGWK